MTGEGKAPHPAFTHRALLYTSPPDYVATVAPFIADGRRRGFSVLVVTTSENAAALREVVPVDCGDVEVADAADWYARPSSMFARYQQYLDDHKGRAGRLRIVGEQVLAGRSTEQIREMARCEAAGNVVFASSGAQIICPYRVTSTSSAVIDDVLRTHPAVIQGGVTRSSEHYVEPSTFVRAHQRETPPAEPTVPVSQLPSPFTAADARRFVADRARAAGLSDEKLSEFVTGVNEVVSNALEHAVLVDMRTWARDDWFVCEVRDFGFGLTDPLAGYVPPSSLRTTGRGLWLARQLSDALEIFTGAGGTSVRLHVKLA